MSTEEENKPKVEEEIPDAEKQAEFSHDELVKLSKNAISRIIESDPLFSDLPRDPTVEEIKAQIAVAQGQAITLYLDRGKSVAKLSIVVPLQNTTVSDLKNAVKRHTNLYLQRQNIRNKISWKHIWRKYCLSFNDTKLLDDKETLKSYGIRNKDKLQYVKIYRQKNRM